ncbi:MAG: hypothetical protein M1438_09000 [Deltaproteobacteria bacterium]|nr:hypothetical protein [Deltaproteobacteria bacterium]
MRYLRIAACLAALIFAFSSTATGAEVTYSGVPGKFKRGAKGAKEKSSESEAADKEAPQEKGKRTMTVPAPRITVTPGTPEKK